MDNDGHECDLAIIKKNGSLEKIGRLFTNFTQADFKEFLSIKDQSEEDIIQKL